MGSSSASWREQKATGCYAKRNRGKDLGQLEIKSVAVTTCDLRMHSHNRRYAVDTRLTCEGSPFERNSMIAIADHLRPNVMELAGFVKDGDSCDATAHRVQKFTKLTPQMTVYIMIGRDIMTFPVSPDYARLNLHVEQGGSHVYRKICPVEYGMDE